MKPIVEKLIKNRSKTVPILSFPSTTLLGVSVNTLISSSDMQVAGMKAIADRCELGASLNMMDLSVEAECFGAKIRFSDDEVPTVEKGILDDISDAANIITPSELSARAKEYVEGVRKAKAEITHIPVFCGAIGPFSLAGRLFDMTELMMECYDSPDEVATLLSKTTEFIKSYILAYKEAGADGVILAEPAAGLLSPDLAEEFSMPYVKDIIDSVSDENFVFCYHNCGGAVIDMAEGIASLGADIYHFGNAIDISKIIPLMPADSIVMGNVNPLLFRDGTADGIKEAVKKLYDECNKYENFMISSGCDIPFSAKWDNIDAYFATIKELYV